MAVTALLLIIIWATKPIAEETPEATAAVDLSANATAVAKANVDPAVLTQTLDNVLDLEEAAEQIAVAVDLPPDAVRARVLASNCTVCDALAGQAFGTLEGVSVATAAETVREGGTVWLFAGSLICQYTHDDALFRLVACWDSPL